MDQILNPIFLKAQRAALLAFGNGAYEFITDYPEDKPIPGVLLTTSTAREDYIHWYAREFGNREIWDVLSCLDEAWSQASERGLLNDEFEEHLWAAEAALIDTVEIDPTKHRKALFPVHGCHCAAVATCVLAQLENPELSVTVLTNALHSTVRLSDGIYFDLLVDDETIEDFRRLDGPWDELDLSGVPVEDMAKKALNFLFLDDKEKDAA